MTLINKLFILGSVFLISEAIYANESNVTVEDSQRALREVVEKNNLGTIVGTQKATATREEDKQKLQSNVRDGRVIVRLSPNISPQQFQQNLLSVKGGDEINVVKSFPLNGIVSIQSSKPHIVVIQAYKKSTKEVTKIVQSLPGVEFVEPDYIVSKNAVPNDPRFTDLWGLNNTGQSGGTANADINALEAWDVTTGSSDVVVGVIDSGVDYLHPDLAANMWKNQAELNGVAGHDDDGNGHVDDIYGIDPANNDSDPMDDEGHGTHVAGTIGAVGNNNEGVVGVNHDVQMAACKFLTSTGSGYTSDGIECINYFTALKESGVNVVVTNNSWGGGGYSQTLKDAIDVAGGSGIVFAAAAGNDYGNNNDTNPQYPASYTSESIVAVASTDHNDNFSSFSNLGATSVDVAAPGSNILSTLPSTDSSSCQISDNNIKWNEQFAQSDLPNWLRLAYDTSQPLIENRQDLWWQSVTDNDATLALAIDDSLGGNYQNDLFSSISYQNQIDLSETVGEVCLALSVKGENEANYDALEVYVTGDNGATWSKIAEVEDDFSDWQELVFPIAAEFRTNQFRLALVRTTDDSVVYDGYRVDNIKIADNATTARTGVYGSYSGTSMATPHVAGAIALAAAVAPDETVEERIQRVFNNVDVLPQLTGSIATGGRLNVEAMVSDITPPPTSDIIGQAGIVNTNQNWTTVNLSGFAENPVVIMGPPSFVGADPSVARIKNVGMNQFQARVQEWDYLNDIHTPEDMSYLALEPGVSMMPDGSIWEVGRFHLSGTKNWETVTVNWNTEISSALSAGTHDVYAVANMQTYAGSQAATVRMRSMLDNSNTGFRAALFEQESYMGSGHAREEIGYLVIAIPKNVETLSVVIGGVAYDVSATESTVNHYWKELLGREFKFEEEKSSNSEVSHIDELINVIKLTPVEGGSALYFAQDRSTYGGDPGAIRMK